MRLGGEGSSWCKADLGPRVVSPRKGAQAEVDIDPEGWQDSRRYAGRTRARSGAPLVCRLFEIERDRNLQEWRAFLADIDDRAMHTAVLIERSQAEIDKIENKLAARAQTFRLCCRNLHRNVRP
jgi:hypothetical protein